MYLRGCNSWASSRSCDDRISIFGQIFFGQIFFGLQIFGQIFLVGNCTSSMSGSLGCLMN